jgi:hypothetical protein
MPLIDPRSGGAAEPARLPPRYAYGTSGSTGKVLLSSADGAVLTWWDPVAGKEQPLRLDGSVADLGFLRLSPDGKWLVALAGAMGQTVVRGRTDGPRVELEELWRAPAEANVDRCAVTDDGAVWLAPSVWRGELHLVPARAGSTF